MVGRRLTAHAFWAYNIPHILGAQMTAPLKVIDFAAERNRRRPFACATDQWLDDWIIHTNRKELLVLLLQEKARRKRCHADPISK